MNTEDNILLAELLGFQETDIGWYDAEEVLPLKDPLGYEQTNTYDILLFDSEWNWLMACVDKIENLVENSSYSYYVEICRDSCYIHENDFETKTLFCNSVPYNRLESCYLTVVQFVKWYKERNNEK